MHPIIAAVIGETSNWGMYSAAIYFSFPPTMAISFKRRRLLEVSLSFQRQLKINLPFQKFLSTFRTGNIEGSNIFFNG
jgi:hypothetical protein